MQFVEAFSHHHGRNHWRERDLDEWMIDIFAKPGLSVGPGSTTAIRDHVKGELAAEGWPFDVRIDQNFDLTVLASKTASRFIFKRETFRELHTICLNYSICGPQTGSKRLLALPMKQAANRIGSNVANFERVMSELMLFDKTITVPIFLIGFD